MAGERKGVTYEAFVRIALEQLVMQRKLAGQIFWNEKPDDMTIEPDFTVGADKNHPTHVFLITHSGASGNSHMKFWRNMGELVEAKVCLSAPPRVFAIAFDSVIKADLKRLQRSAFDGEIVVGDLVYGPDVLRWIDKIQGRLPNKAEDKSRALHEAAKKIPAVDAALRSLVSDLTKLLAARPTHLERLWTLARGRATPPLRTAKNTSFKKGIAKLLVVENPEAVLAAVASNRPIAPDPLLDDLGWVKPSIAGIRVTDSDLLFIASIKPAGPVLTLVRDLGKKKSLADMLRPLRNAEAFVAVARFLVEHWDSVANPAWLHSQLASAHKDALAYAALRGCVSATYVRPGVVAEALIELLKAGAGRRQGFGLAGLVAILEEQASTKAAVERLATSIGIVRTGWRGANTVSYGYRDWLFGVDRSNFSLTDFELLRVAAALSRAAEKLSATDVAAVLDGLRRLWISNLFEAKFASHRDLDVLDQIVADALDAFGVVFERVSFFPSIWSELARTGAEELNVRSGSTAVFKAREALIVTKSAHDSHTNDKRKELCGRAFAMRYQFDVKTRSFRAREGVGRLVLVLDGSWNDRDLAALLRAGWDNIFYPDEMGELVKAIV